ncbi:MAG: serine/threonine protein kinase [Prevotella sp.]|nr:serine/threonine protein kinase [Prevotella sp.]
MTHLQKNHELKGGKYRIEKVLGQGGFGITYLATTKTTVQGALGEMEVEIKVAIKEFFMKEYQLREGDSALVETPSMASRELASQYRAKFIKEAQSLSRMKHPRIITVADVFEENNTVYYVMRYLSGGSLQDYVRRSTDGHLSENEAVRFAIQIGEGLEYMHTEHQACHYDVKPGNILLDDKGDAVLIDFGLSKNYDAAGQQTSSTPVGISQGFAPLEQYNQMLDKFSPQSDIYSLGATLFFMLTGQVPPEASMVNEDGLPEAPVWVSQRVWKTVEAAMQPRKKDRPQSIRQWREMLASQTASQQSERTFLSPSQRTMPPKEEQTEQPVMQSNETMVSDHAKEKKDSKSGFSILRGIATLIVCVVATILMMPLCRLGSPDQDGVVLMFVFGLLSVLAIVVILSCMEIISARILLVLRCVSSVAFVANLLMLPMWNRTLTYTYILLSFGLAIILALSIGIKKSS